MDNQLDIVRGWRLCLFQYITGDENRPVERHDVVCVQLVHAHE